MDLLSKWARRATVVVTTAVFAVLVPAAAWAAEHPTLVAVGAEVERRRRGIGGLGFLAALCCIVPLVIIVLVVVLIMRRRRPPSA
jgi:hypothetical protein